MRYTVRENGEFPKNVEVPFVVEDGMTYQGKEIYGTVSNRSFNQGVFYVRKVAKSEGTSEGS